MALDDRQEEAYQVLVGSWETLALYAAQKADPTACKDFDPKAKPSPFERLSSARQLCLAKGHKELEKNGKSRLYVQNWRDSQNKHAKGELTGWELDILSKELQNVQEDAGKQGIGPGKLMRVQAPADEQGVLESMAQAANKLDAFGRGISPLPSGDTNWELVGKVVKWGGIIGGSVWVLSQVTDFLKTIKR